MINIFFRAFSSPEPPPRQEGRIQRLQDAELSKERTKLLRKLGLEILSQGKSWLVNWRQFGLALNSSIIRHTEFEGGEVGESIKAWSLLLSRWQKGEGHFISFNLTSSQYALLFRALDDLDFFQNLFPGLAVRPLSDEEIVQAGQAFQRTLKQRLRRQGIVYLPLGYRHGVTNEGHAIACKVELKQDGLIYFHLLNSGNGAEHHPILNYTTTQDKISFRYFPFEVRPEDLWGAAGLTACCHLIRYMADPPHPGFPHYTGNDILDVFHTLGRLVPSLGDHVEKLEAKKQRTGNCSEKAICHCVHDVLIDLGVEFDEIKKIFLNAKLGFLVAGYHNFKRVPSEEHRRQLQNATYERGIALQKIAPILPKDQYYGVIALLEAVRSEIKKSLFEKNAVISKEPQDPSSFPAIIFKRQTKKADRAKSSSKAPLLYRVPTFTIPTISQDLDRLIAEIAMLPPREAYQFLKSFSFLLPIPEWNKEDLWDTIEENQVAPILKKLKRLVILGLKKNPISDSRSERRGHFMGQVLTIHTIYVIVDKLARKCKWTKLQGFASPFIPHLYDFEPRDFASIPLGIFNHRYSQISDYFKKSVGEQRALVIFPIERCLCVEQYVYDSTHSNENSQGINHILFLQRHIYETYPRASGTTLLPLFFKVWLNQMTPKEVNFLYDFAYLASSLFFHEEGKDSSFPQELTFIRDVDEAGKLALKIDDRGKNIFYNHPEERKKREERDKQECQLRGLRYHGNCIYDRFYEFEIRAVADSYPPRAASFPVMTTNDAVCARLTKEEASSYWNLTEPLYRDLLRMGCHPRLKLSLAVHWASNSPIQFGNSNVQIFLNSCFFAPHLLYEQLKEEPLYIESLRAMIDQGLSYFRNSSAHLFALQFLLRTGICFETHYSALFGAEKCEATLLKYKEKIEFLLAQPTLKRVDQYLPMKLNWLLIQIIRNERDLTETFKILKILSYQDHFGDHLLSMCPHYNKWDINNRGEISFLKEKEWLLNQQGFLWETLMLQLKGQLYDPAFRHAFCNGLLRYLLPTYQGEELDWEDHFPSYTSADYVINFSDSTLEHFQKGKLHFNSKNWTTQEHTEHISGDYRSFYDHQNKEWQFERAICLANETRWVRGVSETEIENMGSELFFLSRDTSFIHYILSDKRAGDPDILCCDSENRPFYRIDHEGTFSQRSKITRVDHQGKRLPKQLANLTHLQDKNHPLYQCVLRFSHPSHVLCFINIESGQVDELHFFKFNLHFQRDPIGLASVQFPGFYLQLTETLEELDHFQAAMIIKNQRGDQKVMIPAIKLKTISSQLQKEIELTSELIYENRKDRSYFIFDVDRIDGSLKSKESAAYLYLAFILKMKGEIFKAIQYLNKIKSHHPFSEREMHFFKKISESLDFSPDSLAFNSKSFFLLCDHLNLLSEKQLAGINFDFFRLNSFLKWGEQVYLDYLQAISKDGLSAVSSDLRLAIEEEKAILRTLKRYYDKERRPFPHLLNIRHKLLCTQKKHVIAVVNPKEISLQAPILSKLNQPEGLCKLERLGDRFPFGKRRIKEAEKWDHFVLHAFPNRFNAVTVEARFEEFYEEARRCRVGKIEPFDFTLLACLKVPYDRVNQYGENLGHLLFYIRHFPHLFADLSLDVEKDKEKMDVFKQIVNRVTKLAGQQQYKKFVNHFLSAKATFNFSRKTKLSLPRTNRLLPPQQERIKEKKKREVTCPFLFLRQQLFKRTSSPSTLPLEPPFADVSFEGIASEIHDRFKDGYAELRKRSTFHYDLKSEQLPSVKQALEFERESLRLQLLQLRQKLIEMTNKSYRIREGKLTAEQLHEELEYRLRRSTHQIPIILPEMVMKQVVLMGNSQFLMNHCPLLTHDEIQQVIDDVCDYYYLLTLYKVCGDSFALIEKLIKAPEDSFAIAELVGLLEYEFLDPKEYPEVFYVKVTEGKLPRPDQALIYPWVCQHLRGGEKICFQLKAGGGKTDYLATLFMLRARREGLMPVFLSTQMMYSVDKDNLSATLTKLDRGVGYLELGLHMKLDASRLQLIFEQLEQYYQEGRGLIITPQTYYALKLSQWYAGFQENDEQKVKFLGLILNFFKTKCVLLGDEAHRNLDPITRAIFGMKDFFTLPKEENALFLELLKPLLGFEPIYCQDGRKLSHVACMEKNFLETPSDEEVSLIQKTLAHHMAKSKLLAIPVESRQSIIDYWTDPKSAQPSYLVKEKNGLIALTGNFLLNLLPYLLRLRTELDHSRSIFEEEEFDTPCHHKTPSIAQYEDPYLASSVSIKGTSHRGLSETQIRKLITHLLEKDLEENQEIEFLETPTAQLFKGWIEPHPYPLSDLSINNPEQMASIYPLLRKHQGAIEYYLTHFILPQIGYCIEQCTCTPSHLLNGFHQAILFTATPLSGLIYPYSVRQIRYDASFEAEVVMAFCQSKNQHKIFVDSPETFFSQMQENYSKEFSQARVFLDPSGFFCDSSNDAIAQQWLSASDLDGTLYFKEGHSLKVNKEEKVCLFLREKGDQPIELEGSNVKEALAEMNLDWDALKLGTYHDASHTESANIAQKKGTTAFIFVGDHLCISRLNQSLMRLRGFLDEKMIQNIVWVYTKNVARKIRGNSSQEIDGKMTYAWCVQNEAEELERPIILRAFQEISFFIESYVERELASYLQDPEKQIEIMKRYQAGLLEKKPHDPYTSFAEHEKLESTRTVLTRYAKSHYKSYGFFTPFSMNSQLLAILEEIIAETEAKIPMISSHLTQRMSLEVEQQTRLKRKMHCHQHAEQLDYRPRPYDPISAEGVYGELSVLKPNFPYLMVKISACQAFNTLHLTQDFYFERNQLSTAKQGGESMGLSYLKPIDYFLIVIFDGGHFAIAESNEIVSTTWSDLIQGTDHPKIDHQAFLVTSSGKLVQRGKGKLAPSEEVLRFLLASQWMEDLVIDAALLRGQIVHPRRLLARIKKWVNFPEFWEEIVESQPNPETVNKKAIMRLLGKSAL